MDGKFLNESREEAEIWLMAPKPRPIPRSASDRRGQQSLVAVSSFNLHVSHLSLQ
jgi:hypothetical protein